MGDSENSGWSRTQQFVAIIASLATILVILLGGTFALARGFNNVSQTSEDQCAAIKQLDANLRFYEAAIAEQQKLAPPPQADVTC